VSTYGAGADVSDFAALDHVVEGAHDFFGRYVGVIAVDL